MSVIHYQIKFLGKNFEERKALDKFLAKNVRTYTGTAGKNFCFDFANVAIRDDFLREFVAMLDERGCGNYEFFDRHGVVRA
jgi:hypothetical protein